MNVPNNIYHKKILDGKLSINIEIPIQYEVNAKWEEYKDDLDNSYFEEDYEVDVNSCIDQNLKITKFLEKIKEAGWTITEIKID